MGSGALVLVCSHPPMFAHSIHIKRAHGPSRKASVHIERARIRVGALKKKKKNLQKGVQHEDFPGGHPS